MHGHANGPIGERLHSQWVHVQDWDHENGTTDLQAEVCASTHGRFCMVCQKQVHLAIVELFHLNAGLVRLACTPRIRPADLVGCFVAPLRVVDLVPLFVAIPECALCVIA